MYHGLHLNIKQYIDNNSKKSLEHQISMISVCWKLSFATAGVNYFFFFLNKLK